MEYFIIENNKVKHNYYKLTLDLTRAADLPIPRQFYNLRRGKGKDPLLRRPFSMHRLIKRGGAAHLEILYLVVAKVPNGCAGGRKGKVWMPSGLLVTVLLSKTMSPI